MNQDEVYGHLLTRFFAEYDYPELSWMHDIACKRYGEAASRLIFANVATPDLARKQVSLPRLGCTGADGQLVSGIGKLAAVAEIKVNGESAERAELLECKLAYVSSLKRLTRQPLMTSLICLKSKKRCRRRFGRLLLIAKARCRSRHLQINICRT